MTLTSLKIIKLEQCWGVIAARVGKVDRKILEIIKEKKINAEREEKEMKYRIKNSIEKKKYYTSELC